jgi:hypothetical protein
MATDLGGIGCRIPRPLGAYSAAKSTAWFKKFLDKIRGKNTI